ncbi:hypothetical protein KWH04_17740 [Xanthomonas campestris pv. trichodesmae]|uniref:RES domain-containing protein n=2 Tax=Xanthomonas citri TaxID=346 RepID=A0AB33CM72_XANCI|nr:hypothetical protein XcvCFBP7111P_24735 [Xanthomonas citri pv. vignicola]MBV6782449.1 hypothetical protein [Xanthomonas campestris pv. trichodesmae]MBZ3922103.1 hypothetical protein [Xanthomonas campestris pv. trichodesmae]MBZ3926194.1 hypothetical protein [Xanthomonas citri pv. sesbaniae]
MAANPRSEARGALVGTHAMFYAADSLSGALWEAALRYVEIGRGRVAHFPLFKLRGLVASRIRPCRADLPLLELGRPGILALFPDGDGPEVLAVNALLATPRHQQTHPEFRQLQQDLQAVGVPDMPVLSWPSRQFPKSTVYLAYEPPMEASWWEVLDSPTALDDPAGHALIQAELARHGFTFEPLDTIPPGTP